MQFNIALIVVMLIGGSMARTHSDMIAYLTVLMDPPEEAYNNLQPSVAMPTLYVMTKLVRIYSIEDMLPYIVKNRLTDSKFTDAGDFFDAQYAAVTQYATLFDGDHLDEYFRDEDAFITMFDEFILATHPVVAKLFAAAHYDAALHYAKDHGYEGIALSSDECKAPTRDCEQIYHSPMLYACLSFDTAC